MSDTDGSNPRWQDRPSLVYAWLLLFFPLGLYGLWSSGLMEPRRKWQITGVVGVLLVLGSVGLLNYLYALVFAPAAIWLLWRDKTISRTTFRYFAIGAAIAALMALASATAQMGPGAGAGSCAAVQTYGNCTYYRDDQCNVIGQSCQ